MIVGLWSRAQEETDGCFVIMVTSRLLRTSPSTFKTLNKSAHVIGLFQSTRIKHYTRSSNTKVPLVFGLGKVICALYSMRDWLVHDVRLSFYQRASSVSFFVLNVIRSVVLVSVKQVLPLSSETIGR